MHRLLRTLRATARTTTAAGLSLTAATPGPAAAADARALSSTVLRRAASTAASRRLRGKTVLITGASSGIGRSTALEFARTAAAAAAGKDGEADLRLVLAARRIDLVEKLVGEIESEFGGDGGVKALPVRLDVGDAEAVKGFVEGLPKEWRDIDVLVNNA